MREDRRRYPGHDRRKNGGKVFKNSEQIQLARELALEKLKQYEKDEGAGVYQSITLVAVAMFLSVAVAGSLKEHMVLLLSGVIGAVISATVGVTKTINAAMKAREKFEKDPNMHLTEHLPS